MSVNRSLAGTYVAATIGALYVAKFPTQVGFISLYSTHADAQTVILSIKRKGEATAWKFARAALTQNQFAHVLTDKAVLDLSEGDAIMGVTTTVSAVECVITGIGGR